ncbi:serine/threonine-protein kinase [Streptomyces sp. NBC_01483]|uniref:serine/threonine-protein kinase n=1 Tax=Streptomyces sp. NBC_01483 TaxID=2903883 RepID=UPI002E2EECC3|nr:serine/threonine-protein kinase [Streptomyces sp. NBC_01483]
MAPQRNSGADPEAELPEYAGQYRLDERLGSGGMGVVHLARSGSGLRLAVKVVHAAFAKDPEFRGRFRQEVTAARRVSGAFTAPVVDADPEAERPWMATLFIPGPTLAEQVKRNGPMPASQLRRLMAGLAEALRDIHRVGVVHRDLKPSNVLLAEDGPKVIDFGISRPSDSELRTETGKLIGTPPFMAPEQFRRPREVGPAADIFALGSVMVHAATGSGPFDSDSPYIVAYQVVHDEPDLTDVPGNLAPLITRCLAKEPEDRPTPDELMRELRSVAASYDTQAFIPAQRTEQADAPAAPEALAAPADAESPPPARRPKNRALRRVALAVGTLLLVAGGALAAPRLFGQDDSSAAPQDHRQRSAPAAFSGWDTKPAARASGMPQCSYGGGKLFCAQPGLVSALDPVDGKVLWRHASTERSLPDGAPAMSGGLVHAVTHAGRLLEALDPASGKLRWKMDLSAYGRLQHAGGMVLLTRADGTVSGVDGATGENRWSRRLPGQTAPNFAAFAGDELGYATSTTDDGSHTQVTAVDPETGDVRWNTGLKGTLYPVGAWRGTVSFTSVDKNTQTDALVQYDPKSRTSHRVALDVALPQAQTTVYEGTVYMMSTLGALVAVDMDARKQRWRLETSVSRGSAPAADTKYVYFTAADGRLLAVDAVRGKLVGQTRTRLGAQSDRVAAGLPTPLIAGGGIYASAPDGTVFGVAGDDPAAW